MKDLPVQRQKARFHRIYRAKEEQDIGDIKLHVANSFHLSWGAITESHAVENRIVFDWDVDFEDSDGGDEEYESERVEPVVPVQRAVFTPVN